MILTTCSELPHLVHLRCSQQPPDDFLCIQCVLFKGELKVEYRNGMSSKHCRHFLRASLYGPILERFEVLTPLQKPPPELDFLEYVLVWVRKQNRAFISDSCAICGFFPLGGHFLGSGPDRGQSPVEWGDFPSVRRSICSSPLEGQRAS